MSEPVNEPGGGCAELCRDAGFDVECCGSCHSDADAGYEWEIEVEHNGRDYTVCCAVHVGYERHQALASRPPGAEP